MKGYCISSECSSSSWSIRKSINCPVFMRLRRTRNGFLQQNANLHCLHAGCRKGFRFHLRWKLHMYPGKSGEMVLGQKCACYHVNFMNECRLTLIPGLFVWNHVQHKVLNKNNQHVFRFLKKKGSYGDIIARAGPCISEALLSHPNNCWFNSVSLTYN